MKKFVPALSVIVVVLLVASGAAAVYFYQQLSVIKANPQVAVQQEADALVVRISRLIVLPEGEVPTIATVVDAEKLKEQPFFANAKNGNKVLIYTNARRAILYDPVRDKIVEVAPLNIGNPQSTSVEEISGSGKETPAPEIEVPVP